MTAHSISSSMWFFGMQTEEIRCIRDAAGAGYDCRLLDSLNANAIMSLLEDSDNEPLLIWLDGKTWLRLRDENPELLRHLLLAPTVLALENDAPRDVLELALATHVQQVVRLPLVDEQIFDALSRAREARNIFDDMARMAREIHIGRELMERKSSVCALLFHFFEHVSAAANARDVLASCAASFSCFPVDGVHGVWWGQNGPAYALVSADAPVLAGPWFAFLAEQTAKLRPAQQSSGKESEALRSEIRCLCVGGKAIAPESGQTLLLTLEVGNQVCGVLALHLRESCLSGRDAALALNAMRRHLALVMWEGAQREGFFEGAERLALTSAQKSTKTGKARAM